jgi:hypothetical protein
MATKEFEKLALNEHHYPTWATNIEMTIASHGIIDNITAPITGANPTNDVKNNTALFLLRLYIHKDLKQEYLMERCPHNLWKALKERYEQQKELIWPSVNHEWNHLRLQDFKYVALTKLEILFSWALSVMLFWLQGWKPMSSLMSRCLQL